MTQVEAKHEALLDKTEPNKTNQLLSRKTEEL